jgi:membrane protease YdiL (CAAX protease family)
VGTELRSSVHATHPEPVQRPAPPPAQPKRRRVEHAPPRARYDQLARTPLHRWWRPLAGTLLVLVISSAWSFTVLAVGIALDGHLLTERSDRLLAVVLVSNWAGAPVALLAARWAQRRPAGSVSSVEGRLRGRWLLHCAGTALVIHLIPILTALLVVPGLPGRFGWVGWRRFLVTALVALLIPLQVAGEEYVFRGWLLQAIGAYVRKPWPGIVVTSALFCLAHGGSVWALAYYLLFGVLLAVLTIRTGGLEAGIALHTVNNCMLLLLIAAAGGTGLSPRDVTVARSAAGWQALVPLIAPQALFAGLILWSARRRGVATVTAAPSDSAHPTTMPATG